MKIPSRPRELLSLSVISAAFLMLIPAVPSIEGQAEPSIAVQAAAVAVFVVGLVIGWRREDSIAVGVLKVALFIGYALLLSLRASYG